MDIIYNHQHPVDCSKAKFLISGGYGAGYGSQVHVEGQGMYMSCMYVRRLLIKPGWLYTTTAPITTNNHNRNLQHNHSPTYKLTNTPSNTLSNQPLARYAGCFGQRSSVPPSPRRTSQPTSLLWLANKHGTMQTTRNDITGLLLRIMVVLYVRRCVGEGECSHEQST